MFLIILIAGIKHVEMTQTYVQWPPNFLPWSRGWGGRFEVGGGLSLPFLAHFVPTPHPTPAAFPLPI